MLFLTDHSRDRYAERFHKKGHLERNQLRDYVIRNVVEIDKEIRERVGRASEECSYLNDSNFLCYLYDKYGVDKHFKFMADGDALFVLADKGNQNWIVITCMDAKTHVNKHLRPRHKYRKREPLGGET